MAKIPLRQIASLYNDDEKNGIIEVSKIDVPHTTIQNRAQIIDLANDMGSHMGVNRIMIEEIKRVSGEYGPNGESVYSVVNDKFDQIRVYGDIRTEVNNLGSYIRLTEEPDSMEVTFFGTGLNLLMLNLAAGLIPQKMNVSVDGGAATTLDYNGSGALSGRLYSANSVFNVVSGLSLGLHTIKITHNSSSTYGIHIHGVEVVNESANIDIAPGTTYIDNIQVDYAGGSTSYNSGWTNEYGTSGTKGGQVITYIDNQGNIKKDIQWVDTTTQYLATTDHSNEEVITVHNFREFGSGRTDDFSSIIADNTAKGNKAYTLSDGTTTLASSDAAVWESGSALTGGVYPVSINSNLTFTFVGTGLDLISSSGNATTTWTVDIYIDGVLTGTLSSGWKNFNEFNQICSGLPYGSHTVRLVTTAQGGTAPTFSNLIVYGPKKPELPESCVELNSYFLMADYSVDTVTQTSPVTPSLSQGVLHKDCTREMTYVDGTGGTQDFAVVGPIANNNIGGYSVSSNRTGAYIEYTFFGTGFDFRGTTDATKSNNILVELNGVTLTSTNYPTATFSTPNDYVYNSSTAILDQSQGALKRSDIFSVADLPLGIYTVRFTNNTTNYMELSSFCIHTPIHAPKVGDTFIKQNAARVGSQGLVDNRVINEKSEEKIKALSVGVISDYTITPLPTQFTPIGDMSTLVKTSGGELNINFSGAFKHPTLGWDIVIAIFVDGERVGNPTYHLQQDPVNYTADISCNAIAPVEAGHHLVEIRFRTGGGGSVTATAALRNITIQEL
jgi:hypothetical protein